MKVPAGSHALPSSQNTTKSTARGRLLTALSALALVLGVFAVAAPAQAADQAAVSDWLGRINSLRASNGLGALQIDGNMQQLAQDRAQTNGQTGVLAHTPNMSAGVTSNWSKLGENVGVGSNRDVIWQAFLASTPHRANLLDGAFTHIGIGEVTVNGQIWVTHRFLTIASAPAPAPAPIVVPAPAPAPVQVVVPQAPRVVAPAAKPSTNSNSNTNKSASNSGGSSAGNGSGDGSSAPSGGESGPAPADAPPAAAAPADPPANPAPNAEAVVDALRVLQQ